MTFIQGAFSLLAVGVILAGVPAAFGADADAEWRRTTAENISPDGIRANLAALVRRGERSRQAASWLIIAGADAVEPAHEMLADPATTDERSFRDVLLRALAEISNPDEFEEFSEAYPDLGTAASFREMRALVAFHHTDGDLKIEAARRLMGLDQPWDRQEAVGFLVEAGRIDVLSGYLQLAPHTGRPLLETILHSPRGVQIDAQIRRMGYRLEDTAGGLRLVPASEPVAETSDATDHR